MAPGQAPLVAGALEPDLVRAIVDGAGEKIAIEGRIGQIKAQIEETTSDCDREKLQDVWRSWPAASR
jgi:hypothetical protein